MKKNQRKPKLLAAEGLAKDPRVAEAKRLLRETVHDHQKLLTGVRPPNPALELEYKKLLKAVEDIRGIKLWFPYIGSGIGNGVLVELLDGSVKYDFITGIGPHVFGHSHPTLIDAYVDAALTNTTMQGHLQQNADSCELARILCDALKMDHCFLTTTGAMANENAFKIAFQKRFPANRVLAFDHCFAGRTIILSQVTDKPSFREGLPANTFVDYVPFYDATKPEESTQKAVQVLKKHLARHPKEYALMIFELVQGEGGFYPGSTEFFTALMKILKENQISIFMDEVQTFGRTSALCAFQHFGLSKYADIVSIGKLSQVCATFFNKDHCPKPGLLSQTFISSTAAIHASMTVIKELLHGGYFGPKGKNEQIHKYFSKKLSELAKRHPKLVKGPFGIGAMVAFTPANGDLEQTKQFIQDLFKAGVMSFIAGSNPARVRFLVPAGVVTFQDIDQVVQILEKTLLESFS